MVQVPDEPPRQRLGQAAFSFQTEQDCNYAVEDAPSLLWTNWLALTNFAGMGRRRQDRNGVRNGERNGGQSYWQLYRGHFPNTAASSTVKSGTASPVKLPSGPWTARSLNSPLTGRRYTSGCASGPRTNQTSSTLARGWARALRRVSTVSLVTLIAIAVGRDISDVVGAAAAVTLVALVTVTAALLAGWAVGSPGRASRSTAALVTATRASTPALAVASGTYGLSSDAASAIVVFALVSLLVSGLVAVSLARAQAREAPRSARAAV